jgi:hypothetical protein
MRTLQAMTLKICLAGCFALPCRAQAPKAAVGSDTLLFEKICDKMKQAKGDYTIGGLINLTDPVHPEQSIKNAPFLFCKQGDQFYYRLGTTETINGRELYLYIDHQTKNIMLSPRKEVMYDPSPVKPIDLGEAIRSEHYSLGSAVNGPLETLTLLNERHISCKQYSVTFNREGLNITRLFMRLTYLREPMRRDKETTVDVRITRWEQTADISKYPNAGSVLVKVHGRWQGNGELKNYRVIEM